MKTNPTAKTKIILDSDVVIHFIKGEHLCDLPNIFPQYQYVILDIVFKNELAKNNQTKTQLQNHIHLLKSISIETWSPDYEMMKEFSLLNQRFGIGESACLVYCKYNHDVLASSNLHDIKAYCEKHQITYLTTMDFLYHAIKKKIMTEKECDKFITSVLAGGSKLPVKCMRDFSPRPVVLY